MGRGLRDNARLRIVGVGVFGGAMYKPSIDEVKGDREWSLLEQDLLDECKLGMVAYLPGKGDCPKDQSDPDRRVRAGLIRYLLLGGCKTEGGARPHPKGVQLMGAWIDGGLDFEGCTTRLNLALHHCFFRDGLVFRDAELGGLYLTGSRAEQRVDLQRLTTITAVHLSDGFHATGLVDLGGARIGGQLSCVGGRFDDGINLDSARIGAALFWCRVQGDVPEVDLTEAKVRVLVDDLPSWDKVTELHLFGFTYERIQSGMGIADRLEWLDGKRERDLPTEMQENLRAQPWLGTGAGFDPQPYTQLARVLEDQGNRGGAARVREVRESKLRVAEQFRAFGRVDGTFRAAFGSIPAMLRRLWDFMFRWMFGYGHQPARALLWVTGIWLLAFLLYSSVYAAGQMTPNLDVILTSADWLEIAKAYKAGDEMPMHA